jgi:hypothetical protein
VRRSSVMASRSSRPRALVAPAEADDLVSLLRGPSVTWDFARRAGKLESAAIRELSERLASMQPPTAALIFLCEAVRGIDDDCELVEVWTKALRALLDIKKEDSWGSKRKRALITGLAQSPRLLAAMQAAVVGDLRAPAEMLAVLAADGSEALLPAFAGTDRFAITRLETHAADTPAMKLMVSSIRERSLEEEKKRRATSFGLAFARKTLGLDVEVFDARVALVSVEINANHVRRIQGGLSVGSGYWVRITHVTPQDDGLTTSWSDQAEGRKDGLDLGFCEFDELPQWLERAQKKLRVTWQTEKLFPSGTPGRARFVDWLFGPTRAANAKRLRR